MALGGRLLQSRRRDEHRWDRPGQHGEYASDRSGNGASSLARRRYGAELRARRRQARERALFANRATDREATLVGGFHRPAAEREGPCWSIDLPARSSMTG